MTFINRDVAAIFCQQSELQYTVSMFVLKTLKDTYIYDQAFADKLRQFFENFTDHFVHELIIFAESLLYMREFDENVNYSGTEFSVRFIFENTWVFFAFGLISQALGSWKINYLHGFKLFNIFFN